MGLPYTALAQLRRKEYLGTFQAVAPSTAAAQQTTLEVAGAWNVETLQVLLGSITSAMIQQVQLFADGVLFQTWSGTVLDKRIQYDGGPSVTANNVLTLPFNRLAVVGGLSAQMADKTVILGDPVTVAGVSSLNMGTGGGGLSAIQVLRIQLTIINSPVTTSSMPVYGVVTAPLAGGPGPVLRVLQQSKTMSNGSITINKSEFGFDAQTQYLNRIYFDASSGLTMDQIKIMYGGALWWNYVPEVVNLNMEAGLLGPVKTLPQAGFIALDFQEGGIGTDMLDLTNPTTDFNVQFTAGGLTGSPAIPFYCEVLGPAKAS